MAQYGVIVKQVYVYAKEVMVKEAESEEDARAQVLHTNIFDGPNIPHDIDGWCQVQNWVSDDWQVWVIDPNAHYTAPRGGTHDAQG